MKKIGTKHIREMVRRILQESEFQSVIAQKAGEIGLENITDRNEIKPLINEIYNLMVNGYSSIGGFKNASSARQFLNQIDLLTIYREEDHIYAAASYSNYLGGNKLCAFTHDGSLKGSNAAHAIIERDIQNYKDGYWVEASGRVEELFDRYNGYPIQSIYAEGLLKKSVEETGDGYHYRRKIKDDIFTKKIYGYRDEEFFNMIVSKIQEEMGYENEMDNINGVINEALDINSKIQSAIFIVGRISESLNEYGYDCITQKTHDDLCKSIKLLKQMQPHVRDIRIGNYIMLGEDIINTYPILKQY